MAIIDASSLQADLRAIAQARIRALGNKQRTFTLRVYDNADTTATTWITRFTYYDFSAVVIDALPTTNDLQTGEVVSADSVFRVKEWLIGNLVTKFKGVMALQKTIDGRI